MRVLDTLSVRRSYRNGAHTAGQMNVSRCLQEKMPAPVVLEDANSKGKGKGKDGGKADKNGGATSAKKGGGLLVGLF